MNKITLLVFSTILLTLGCTKEEPDIRLAEFETPILTGFELRDEVNILMKVIGNPNIKLGNKSNNYNSEYFFCTYPNPCKNYCTLNIKTPNSNEKKQVWIVQAQYNDNSTSATNLGNTNLMSAGGAPLVQAEFTSDFCRLDISNLNDGYYRVYLKVKNQILYDNLIIKNN